ncbi:MAG: transcription antitermination factor NusB [Oscillospiraceae bacterium]
MSVKRRDIRESAFIIIFESSFQEDSIDEIAQTALENGDILINDDVVKLAKNVCGNIPKLDEIIAKYSRKRAVERIPKVNLAILRLAIYEAVYDDKVPVNVAISEAVALAEKYALDADVSFINGVLGSFSRSDDALKNE